MEFPKTKYGMGGGTITVEDAHHEKMLGGGWSDNPPFRHVAPEAPKADPPKADPPKVAETAAAKPVEAEAKPAEATPAAESKPAKK